MISVWVDVQHLAEGEPILARTSTGGTYKCGLLEINDAHGARIATIRYSPKRLPGTLSRVWIDIEDTATVTITERRLLLQEGRVDAD